MCVCVCVCVLDGFSALRLLFSSLAGTEGCSFGGESSRPPETLAALPRRLGRTGGGVGRLPSPPSPLVVAAVDGEPRSGRSGHPVAEVEVGGVVSCSFPPAVVDVCRRGGAWVAARRRGGHLST